MEILILTGKLREALEIAHSVAEKKSPNAILGNIKIDALEGIIKIIATDMVVYVECEIEGKIINEGSVSIHSRMLYDIVRQLNEEDEINISFDIKKSTTVNLSVLSGKFSIPSFAIDKFPVFDSNDNYAFFEIKASDFFVLLKKTMHAISNDEVRYYLNGVYIYTIGKLLRAVATDGHRIARVELPFDDSTDIDIEGAILHKKMVHELTKVLNKNNGYLNIGIGKRKMKFISDNKTMITRLIDGKFPDYVKAIPIRNDKYVDINAQSIMRAIDLVTAISTDKLRIVKITIEKNCMTVSASSEMDGNAKGIEVLEVQYDLEPIKFCFNAKYLADTITAASSISETVEENTSDMVIRLLFSDYMTAVIVKNATNDCFLGVLMPIQV